jgi:hypothetical protein
VSTRTVTAAAIGALLGVAAFAVHIGVQAARLDTAPGVDGTLADGVVADATAPDLPMADAAYALWGRNADGTPVRWDPCSPIPWVLDDREAPADARATVEEAMARITDASGLRFEYRGRTTESPSRDRSLVAGEPTAWAPVLVTWVPGGSTDLPLGDTERGVAVPVAVVEDDVRTFVTGQVLLNADKRLAPGFVDRHASWGAVVLHELSHLVGLDHVDDPRQLMHPVSGFGPVEFGDGDLAGLAAVGADGGCLAVPEPRELDVTFG